MKTTVLLTIEHEKPLPECATDVIAQRTYGWCFSQGCKVDVTAQQVPEVVALQVRESEGE